MKDDSTISGASAPAGTTAQHPLAWLACASPRMKAQASVVLVAAHPDDEVIGAGSRLGVIRSCALVHITDGAPRDGCDARMHGFCSPAEYSHARRRELESAVALAGIRTQQLYWLGCPDQAASLLLVPLAQQLAHLLSILNPRFVITHPFEGGHPDHDAAAFITHAALHLLRQSDVPTVQPQLIEMTSYHNSPAGLEAGCFLPSDDPQLQPITIDLSHDQQDQKTAMFRCFATQAQTLQYFPVSVERFRVAPHYNFCQPPHDGTLFYENFPWGMTGSRFCSLAARAIAELGLGITSP